MNINYIKGDATSPNTKGNKIIVHICNDIGGWGKGFVMAISKKWKEPEVAYRNWYKTSEEFELGNAQFIKVEEDLWVANIIGQHKINIDEFGNIPLRYDATSQGLEKVQKFAKDNHASIHMPRIGCGLAGGKWELMEPIIIETLIKYNIEVYVYDI